MKAKATKKQRWRLVGNRSKDLSVLGIVPKGEACGGSSSMSSVLPYSFQESWTEDRWGREDSKKARRGCGRIEDTGCCSSVFRLDDLEMESSKERERLSERCLRIECRRPRGTQGIWGRGTRSAEKMVDPLRSATRMRKLLGGGCLKTKSIIKHGRYQCHAQNKDLHICMCLFYFFKFYF